MERLVAVPIDLRFANEMIAAFHRHHKPVKGHKWSIAAARAGVIIGVAIVGRPVARALDPSVYIEVSRLVVAPDEPHVCSFLYGKAARIAKEFGYREIQTYILDDEPGTSLKAAGWEFSHYTTGGDWNRPSRGGRRTDQPLGRKQCWRRVLA